MTKKMFFIATLLVAGLASANTQKNETETDTNKAKKEVSKKDSSAQKTQSEGCFPFTLSCGISGTACGSSTLDLLSLILDVDNAICGRSNV